MTDLNNHDFQSNCKKLQRTTIVTNVLMCLVTALCIAMAIYVSTLGPRDSTGWAEISFYILIGVIVAYFAFVFAWEFRLRRANRSFLYAYLLERLKADPSVLNGGESVSFELSVAGDALTLMNAGTGAYLRYDLSPIKTYANACALTVRYLKELVADHYFLSAKNGAVKSVTLTDKVRKNEKVCAYIIDGAPAKDRSKSFAIASGLLS